MKQMYGDLFHDICVYSDVCNLLAEHHYHIQARRYMHELFLDAPFKEASIIYNQRWTKYLKMSV